MDRVKGFTVALAEDCGAMETAEIAMALRRIRGVISVEAVERTADDPIIRQRTQLAMWERLWAAVGPQTWGEW